MDDDILMEVDKPFEREREREEEEEEEKYVSDWRNLLSFYTLGIFVFLVVGVVCMIRTVRCS